LKSAPDDNHPPHVLLCVTGCAQAERTPRLARNIIHHPDSGDHEVIVAATVPSLYFFERAAVEKLTGRRVFVEHTDATDEFEIPHIGLAEWADVVIVYPASANTLAKCAHGLADSLVANVVLATRSPVYFGPCMNELMYDNPVTQRNLKILEELGHRFLPKEIATAMVKSTGEITETECHTERMVLAALTELFRDRG
jgi:phosphopantothenoylcysteine decarboxylase/phosphopantothenate--cysteine ligase